MGQLYRVKYRNAMDKKMRVLVGQLTKEEAIQVAAIASQWGDRADLSFFMGAETKVEECDGKLEGAILDL